MNRLPVRLAFVLALACLAASPLSAQTPDDNGADDAVLKPAEPDYTIVNLPTSLRLPRMKSAFRVTHRFVRPINCDDAQRCPDSLASDLFGLDNGALIGLEYRIGLVTNLEIGVHRARSDKTIDLFGQYGLTRQSDDMPLEMAVRASVEGTNNFRDEYSPTVALIITRLIGERAALYVEPIWAGNTNLSSLSSLSSDAEDDSTFMIGLGTRIRVRPTVYLVGEFLPRVSGFKPGTHQGSFGIEKRAGGHMFQLNVSNAFSTTLGQAARAAENSHDWYLGFNLARKFF